METGRNGPEPVIAGREFGDGWRTFQCDQSRQLPQSSRVDERRTNRS